MYTPKTDIYKSLKTLNYFVSQNQPEIFKDLPAIIFKVGNNAVNPDLDNNILSQDLEIIIDIWAETSVQASEILSEVEEIMRLNQYHMTFSYDVPNTGNLFHINNRFSKSL